MALSAQFSVRLERLQDLSRTILHRKEYSRAFNALEKQDRKRILDCLKLLKLDGNKIGRRELQNRVKKEVRIMTKEIRNKTINHLPQVLLQSILHYLWETPARIAPVCIAFNLAQKKSYEFFLRMYAIDPSMADFAPDLTLASIKKLTPEACNKKVKEIYQRIKDHDLLLFYKYIEVEAMYQHAQLLGETVPDFSYLYDEAAQAACIRKWMRENRTILSKIKRLDLGQLGLRALPAEIRLLGHLQVLILTENALRILPSWIGRLKELKELVVNMNRFKKLPKEMGQLVKLTHLSLNKNQLEELPKEFDKLVNLVHLNLAENKLKRWPRSIDKLGKLRSLFITGNPFSSKVEILAHYFDYFSRLKNPLGLKGLQALRKLYSRAASSKKKQPIQDRFNALIKKMKDSPFRRFLEGMIVEKSINDLEKAWKAPSVEEMILESQKLPETLRHRIYAFSYFLEKKKGRHITHKHFGRRAFRNEGEKFSNPSMRSKALQLTLLETVYENILKKKEGEQNSQDFLELFSELDESFQQAIYHHLEAVEKEEGRYKEESNFGEQAFLNTGPIRATFASCLKAIGRFLKEINS